MTRSPDPPLRSRPSHWLRGSVLAVVSMLITIGVLATSLVAMQVLFALGHPAHPYTGRSAGSVTMVAGHAVAVIATGLMVMHADTMLGCLAGALVAILPVRWTQPPPATRLVTCPPRWVGGARRRQVLRLVRNCPRRGPPCFD